MAGKNTAAFGIYSDRTAVENAVEELKRAGYRNTDISVLFPETSGTKDFAHEKHTKAPEGATTGAGTGVVVGGTLGWLAGIGALAIPGLGPFIAAGPIMAALAGAGVGGTVGGVVGALVGMRKRHGSSNSDGSQLRTENGVDKENPNLHLSGFHTLLRESEGRTARSLFSGR